MKTKNLCLSFRSVLVLFVMFLPAYRVMYAQEGEKFNEDARWTTKSQRLQIKRLNMELRAKVDPIAKRDPRYKAYLRDFEEIKTIKDDTELEKKSKEFQNKYEPFRNDVLNRAGVDLKAYNLRLKKILPRIRLDSNGLILREGPVSTAFPLEDRSAREDIWFTNVSYDPYRDSTIEFTSFPNTWTYKDCSDGSASFDDENSLSSYSETDVAVNDCTDVKAARGVIVRVPAGTRKVRITVDLGEYFIRSWASCYGIFAYADSYASVGIRLKKRGTSYPVQYVRFRHSESAWSVFGLTSGSKTETNVVMSGTFSTLGPGDYDVQAYVRTASDTDGFAIARTKSRIDNMSKIKVTLMK